MLTARRTDRLTALATEIERNGHRALAIACDVTVPGDLERAVAEALKAFGRIDVAVANAGFGVVGAVERLTPEDYHRQFETNVFGVLRTIHATLPELKARRGRLVVIGSVSGHLATPGSSPYAMSKFAVRALAEALGHEVAHAGVSVTHVSPGSSSRRSARSTTPACCGRKCRSRSGLAGGLRRTSGAEHRAGRGAPPTGGRRDTARQGGGVLPAPRAVAGQRGDPPVRGQEPGRADEVLRRLRSRR